MTLRVTPAEIVSQAEKSSSPGLLGRAARWPRVPLRDVARVVNGAPYSSSLFNKTGDGVPLVRIRDIGADAPSTWYSGEWDQAHKVTAGSILVGMDGDFNLSRWRCEDGVLNQRVCRLDVNEEKYDPRLLSLILPGYLRAVWARTSATTVKHLSSRSIADIPLPYPSWKEQQQIVDVLDDHLSRLDAGEELLRLSALKASAWMDAMAEKYLWQRADHQMVRVDTLLREPMRNGHSARAVDGDAKGVRTLTLTAVTRRRFDDRFTKITSADPGKVKGLWLRPGDVLVQRANTKELVGTTALFDGPKDWAIFPDLLIRLRVDASVIDPRYLSEVMQSRRSHEALRSRAKGLAGSMPKIDQEAVASTLIPLIPIDEQQRVVDGLSEARAIHRRASDAALLGEKRSSALRTALLTAAFSGRLTGRSTDTEVVEEIADSQGALW